MEQTDLQALKLRLIEQFLRVNNVALLAKVEEMLLDAEMQERERTMPPLTEEQGQELERRYQRYRENPSSARPWEEVRAELMAKHGYDG
ncbi:MAG TPA: addiction module protein [Candidatus Obscuribacterales bacterium]